MYALYVQVPINKLDHSLDVDEAEILDECN